MVIAQTGSSAPKASKLIPQPGTSAFKAYLRSTGNDYSSGSAAYMAQQSIPPVGTSARKAFEYNKSNGENPTALLRIDGGNNSNDIPTLAPSRNSTPTARDYSGSSVSPQTIDYLNADLAKYYGMSKATAYQEALENTSYRRAMADMKAAGLNPAVMFGAGRVSGAGSVGYVSEDSSGSGSGSGSGGGYTRRSGRSSRNGKLFSTSAYGALSAVGGLVGIAATGRPDGYWIGSSTIQGAMNLMNAFYEAK